MPRGELRYKAGKITFLLVCLFFLTACGNEKVVFQAGEAVTTSVVDVSWAPAKMPTEEVNAKINETPTETEKGVKEEAVTACGKININRADAQQLMTLPGIGESRAAAIIEYRIQAGEFQCIEEIMDVKGIGTGIFSKISSLICVK